MVFTSHPINIIDDKMKCEKAEEGANLNVQEILP